MGKRTNVYGINSERTPVYLHDLEIEICDIPGSKVKTKIGFADLKNVGVLLGQYGFFQHFKVSFDARNETFDVAL